MTVPAVLLEVQAKFLRSYRPTQTDPFSGRRDTHPRTSFQATAPSAEQPRSHRRLRQRPWVLTPAETSFLAPKIVASSRRRRGGRRRPSRFGQSLGPFSVSGNKGPLPSKLPLNKRGQRRRASRWTAAGPGRGLQSGRPPAPSRLGRGCVHPRSVPVVLPPQRRGVRTQTHCRRHRDSNGRETGPKPGLRLGQSPTVPSRPSTWRRGHLELTFRKTQGPLQDTRGHLC